MSINDMKNTVFPNTSYDAWEQAALKTLKSHSLETLYKETYEGIKLSPLYSKKDTENKRENSYFRANNNWKIAQRINSTNWDDLKRQMMEAKERGQETVSFDVDNLHDLPRLDFTEISKIFDFNKTPLLLFTKNDFEIIARNLLHLNVDHLSGAAAVDIISSQIERGYLYKREGQTWRDWTELITKLDEKHLSLKTILIDSTPYHNSGANAVQELAASLAEAIFYIEEMRQIGWKSQKTIQKMIFHFSIGNNFFMEIAKLRAFRILWNTIASAYQIAPEQSNPMISAETSKFTKSLLDPYMNILRSGNEAFAAVIGGIDYLHVAPFKSISDPSDEFSMRIARNTQLLLREEAYLDKVIDPAGGSFYIETLTDNLVEKAWELFQSIDKQGGIYSVLQNGWFQQKIKGSLHKKMEDIRTGKRLMIGINVFKQVAKQQSLLKSKPVYKDKKDMVKIEPLEQARLAEKNESGEY